MKKRKIILRIHLGICLLFGVIWAICIIKNYATAHNEIVFEAIGLVLSASYLINFVTAKKLNNK